MRMRKVTENKHQKSLEAVAKDFINVKKAQKIGETTLYDYEKQLARFIKASHNSTEYETLESDTLAYFAAIPDTSPARYNKPYQYVTALFNWMVKQETIPKNPITANDLKKRPDEGNIKPVSVEELRRFMRSLDKQSYTDLRSYTIILVMMDCGVRTKELLTLRESDYNAAEGTLRVSKVVAKTRRQRVLYLSPQAIRAINAFIQVKPEEWEDWLFPNYEGKQLTTTHEQPRHESGHQYHRHQHDGADGEDAVGVPGEFTPFQVLLEFPGEPDHGKHPQQMQQSSSWQAPFPARVGLVVRGERPQAAVFLFQGLLAGFCQQIAALAALHFRLPDHARLEEAFQQVVQRSRPNGYPSGRDVPDLGHDVRAALFCPQAQEDVKHLLRQRLKFFPGHLEPPFIIEYRYSLRSL